MNKGIGKSNYESRAVAYVMRLIQPETIHRVTYNKYSKSASKPVSVFHEAHSIPHSIELLTKPHSRCPYY